MPAASKTTLSMLTIPKKNTEEPKTLTTFP